MERHLKDAEPRWALVVWPGIATYAELPCCIAITEIDVAMTHGAVVVGREDETFCKPRDRVLPDPLVLRLRFNHPYPITKKPIMRPPLDPRLDDNGCNTEGD
jgi:hypothetical protein